MRIVSAGSSVLLALLVLFSSRPATAAADPLMVEVIAEDWADLDREAHERLAADPLDSAALHALGRLSIDNDVGSEKLRQTLLPQTQACIAAKPADALCHLAYGQILGVALNSQGMFGALGSVGKVRQAFEAAVAADPTDYDARESLVTFYLRAPGIVGGSLRKARQNADEFVPVDADRARLLYALIALQADDPAKAEEEMGGLVGESEDADLNRLVAKRWLAIGLAYQEARNEGKARLALGHAKTHGAPSVAGRAKQALSRLT